MTVGPRHTGSVLSLAGITSGVAFLAIAHAFGSSGMSRVVHVKQVPPVVVPLDVKVAIIARGFRLSVTSRKQFIDIRLCISIGRSSVTSVRWLHIGSGTRRSALRLGRRFCLLCVGHRPSWHLRAGFTVHLGASADFMRTATNVWHGVVFDLR